MTTQLLNIETAIKALNGAALAHKLAFQVEIAVGLSIYLISGGTHLAAKKTLCAVYGSAGWACLSSDDVDYKTVNRRINCTANLYEHLGPKVIGRWAGTHTNGALIKAVQQNINAFELHTVTDVIAFCAPPDTKLLHGPKGQTFVLPDHTILAGPQSGQRKIKAMFKKRSDVQHLTTAHLDFVIPSVTTDDELLQMVEQMLALIKVRKLSLTR